MTATTTASVTSARMHSRGCRPWCDQGADCVDGFHQHAVAQARQYPGGPSVMLALEGHEDDGPAMPSLAISYSRDGEIADGCVTLSLARGRELAYSLLQAIARAENASA